MTRKTNFITALTVLTVTFGSTTIAVAAPTDPDPVVVAAQARRAELSRQLAEAKAALARRRVQLSQQPSIPTRSETLSSEGAPLLVDTASTSRPRAEVSKELRARFAAARAKKDRVQAALAQPPAIPERDRVTSADGIVASVHGH